MRNLTKITAVALTGLFLSTAAASADECHFHWVVGQGFTIECGGNSVTMPGPGGPGGPGQPPGQFKQVCVYKGPNFTGQHVCVNAGMSDAHIGPAWNDQVTSMRFYGGARIRLCQNYNYGGFCNVFWGDNPHLGGALNNNASSYQVW